jgi:hypothetical protein
LAVPPSFSYFGRQAALITALLEFLHDLNMSVHAFKMKIKGGGR